MATGADFVKRGMTFLCRPRRTRHSGRRVSEASMSWAVAVQLASILRLSSATLPGSALYATRIWPASSDSALPADEELRRPCVEEDEAGAVHRLLHPGEHGRVQGPAQRVDSQDVEHVVTHESRCGGHRGEQVLDADAHLRRGGTAPAAGRRLWRVRRLGQVFEVRPLGVVELQCAGHGVQHTVGHSLQVAPLESGVVLDTDPGERRPHRSVDQPPAGCRTQGYPPAQA